MVACTDLHIPFVIDGYITAVAMACATQMNGEAPLYGIPSHYSREVGMAAALAYANIRLDEVPIHGQMALGEGTGAVLMVQLLKTAHFAFMNIGTMVELLENKLVFFVLCFVKGEKTDDTRSIRYGEN